MKRKPLIFLYIILAFATVIAITEINKPYKQTTFVVDGENYTAEVLDDGSLVLNVCDEGEDGEWFVATAPEMYASDYVSETENGAEFHIIPLSEGKGDMAIHYIKEDGSIDQYILTLTISRHKKKYLQIDEIAFMAYDVPHVGAHLMVLRNFFAEFEKEDYAAMAGYCTDYCKETFFHENDVFGMKNAFIAKYTEEMIDENTFKYQVDVKMETCSDSALYPETETTLAVYVVKEGEDWLVDRFSTD